MCQTLRFVVAYSLCWKGACPLKTQVAFDAADQVCSGFLASMEAFKERIDEEVSEGLYWLENTFQQQHLFGYWCLACDQEDCTMASYFEVDYSFKDYKAIEKILRENIDYKGLHDLVTHSLQGLRSELQQLATIDQGKPLLAKCLKIDYVWKRFCENLQTTQREASHLSEKEIPWPFCGHSISYSFR